MSAVERLAQPVRVRAVAFDDAAAVALREAMVAEMRLRYWDRGRHGGTPVEAGEVVWTGVAFTGAGLPVGHALVRRYPQEWLPPGAPQAVELKRMYVVPAHRGTGVAGVLLVAAEAAGVAAGARHLLLHTGDRQPDAVRRYERSGYRHVPVFPPYQEQDWSVCLAKVLPTNTALS